MKTQFKLSFFLITLSLILYSLIAFYYVNYSEKIVPDGIKPGFIDLHVVLYASDRDNQGINPYYSVDENCTDKYNYPYLWLQMCDFLHIGAKDTVIIGFLFIFLFSLTYSSIFRFNSFKQTLVAFFFMFSPPILFLLERANVDIVVFLLVVFSVYLFSKYTEKIGYYSSLFIILFATFLKLFPFFALPYVFLNVNRKKAIIYISLFFFSFIVYFVVNLDLIKTILKVTPKMWELGYGRNILFQEFIPESYLQIVSFSFVSSVIVVLFLFKKVRYLFRELYIVLDNKTFTSNLFFVGLFLLSGQFLFGNNYDYRLVYMGLLLPEIVKQYSNNNIIDRIKYPLIIIYFFVLYSSYLHRTGIPFKNYTQWFIGRNFLMSMKYLSLIIICSFGVYSIYTIVFERIFPNLKKIS